MAKIQVVKLSNYDKFVELLRLEREHQELGARISQLRADILPTVRNLRRVDVNGYAFTVQERRTWKFSAKVAELMGRVAAQKSYEIENHIAREGEPTQYLRVEK